MKIRKVLNSLGTYDFYLNKGDRTLQIMGDKDLNIYMILTNGKDIFPVNNDIIYFDMTKDDDEIYNLFYELYQNILNTSREGNSSYTIDKDNNVYILSDKEVPEYANMMKLSMIGDTLLLTFYYNNKTDLDVSDIIIRFSNTNDIFKNMYDKLQQVGRNYHQTYFDELIKCKKKKI